MRPPAAVLRVRDDRRQAADPGAFRRCDRGRTDAGLGPGARTAVTHAHVTAPPPPAGDYPSRRRRNASVLSHAAPDASASYASGRPSLKNA